MRVSSRKPRRSRRYWIASTSVTLRSAGEEITHAALKLNKFHAAIDVGSETQVGRRAANTFIAIIRTGGPIFKSLHFLERPMNAPCPFDAEQLTFTGLPLEQACCLLRFVKRAGGVD